MIRSRRETGNPILRDNYSSPESVELLERGYALVGAVHQLISASRNTTKHDLVLAAATHALAEGDKTAEEIASVVHQVWPGAKVNPTTVTQALEMGTELGLVTTTAGLDAAELWRLTARGLQDIQQDEAWVADLRTEAVAELRQRARNDLGMTISTETAELWLERIVRALIAGITDSQDTYLGNVDLVLKRRLAPRNFNQSKILELIEDDRIEPATIDFLRAAALAALDPLNAFASELVSHITTGCVLHSYVAGRDSAAVRDTLGSPAGQRALLDTPVLIDLIGPTRVSSQVEFSINAAVKAGWEVVVGTHSIEELVAVLRREVPRIKRDFAIALEQNVKKEWYASLANGQLPSYCVEVLSTGKYRNLEEMQTAASTIAERLTELGVVVRDHYNDNDQSRVEDCLNALKAELEGREGRSAEVMQRDAHSMAMVWRRRKREGQSSAWPGGWVITPDRHMKAAYRSVDPRDSTPLTLTLSQWSTLTSLTVPSTDVVAIAEAAATQLVEEAMWLLPSRFPGDVALELARQISPKRGGSDFDLRYAQLTLDGTLSDADLPSATAMAADVLAARNRRRDSIHSAALERAKSIEAEALAKARAATEAADARERAHRIEVESERTARIALEARADSLERDATWRKIQTGRTVWSFGIAVLLLAALIAALMLDQVLLVVAGIAIALGAWTWSAWRWCTRPQERLPASLTTAVVGALGLASAIVGLVTDLG